MNSFEHVFRRGVLSGMIAERLAGESNRFRDCVRKNIATPLFNDRLPGDAGCHLLQDVGHQDSGPLDRRLAMADLGVGYDESPDHSFGHLTLLTLRQRCVPQARL